MVHDLHGKFDSKGESLNVDNWATVCYSQLLVVKRKGDLLEVQATKWSLNKRRHMK